MAKKTITKIETDIEKYLSNRTPNGRYASFDYCFNYFQSFHEQNRVARLADSENMELSCLHLGFYLASWGMYRGSTKLLQHSVKHLAPVIQFIARAPIELWTIDCNCYSDVVIEQLMKTRKAMLLEIDSDMSDILVTKIMLGVFGNVPAFDANFKRGFSSTRFGPKALRKIGTFYKANEQSIERKRVMTLDFGSGDVTSRAYTRAKVIDMLFFYRGSVAGAVN
jgi:hypothetical protein